MPQSYCTGSVFINGQKLSRYGQHSWIQCSVGGSNGNLTLTIKREAKVLNGIKISWQPSWGRDMNMERHGWMLIMFFLFRTLTIVIGSRPLLTFTIGQ